MTPDAMLQSLPVAFQPPPNWSVQAPLEPAEGDDTALVCVAPNGAACLRVIATRSARSDGNSPRALALRFVRPDDRRVRDRIIDTRADGSVFATATLTEETGHLAPDYHLWFIGRSRTGYTEAVMFALEQRVGIDSRPESAAEITFIDTAISGAPWRDTLALKGQQ